MSGAAAILILGYSWGSRKPIKSRANVSWLQTAHMHSRGGHDDESQNPAACANMYLHQSHEAMSRIEIGLTLWISASEGRPLGGMLAQAGILWFSWCWDEAAG